MSWSDDKELSSGANIISWNFLKKSVLNVYFLKNKKVTWMVNTSFSYSYTRSNLLN